MIGSQTPTSNYLISAVLGIVALVMVVAVLTGRQLPLISTERGAVLALTVIGIVMCMLGGIGPTQSQYGWTHPFMLVGIVLGALALIVSGLTLIGANVSVPLISTDRSALIALSVIIVLKVLMVALQRFIVS